jgi:uncharacterized protein DUF1918
VAFPGPAVLGTLDTQAAKRRSTVANVGDHVVVESEKVGTPPRRGEVTAVSGRVLTVRWDTGEQSTFVPTAGALRVEQTADQSRS